MVDKLERKDLPRVELTRDIIDFEGDCIDEAAQLVLNEALDYAIETSLSRLNSLGRVFPRVQRTGMGALGAVESIRSTIITLPVCKQATEAPLGKIVPRPPAPKPEVTVEPTQKRKEWGASYYVDKEGKRHGPYSNPTALSRELGVEKTKGAGDMIEHFEKLGCAVTADGEGRPEISKTPIIVRWRPGCKLPATVTKPPETPEKREERRFVINPVKVTVGEKVYMTDDQSRLLQKEAGGWVVAKPVRYLIKGKVVEAPPAKTRERPVVAETERVKATGEPSTGAIINKEVWDAMTVEGRVGLAKFRGMPDTTGSKTWDELSMAEIAQLQGAKMGGTK